jgi:hypothetical protein
VGQLYFGCLNVRSNTGILTSAHQLLVYADDVNLQGDSVDTIEKNTQTLIDASKEVGLQVNTEKTK